MGAAGPGHARVEVVTGLAACVAMSCAVLWVLITIRRWCANGSPWSSCSAADLIAGSAPLGRPSRGTSGECGDAAEACVSGYTFMRGGTQVRATADQRDATHDYLYLVYDPSIPGTEVPSGSTYGSVVSQDLPAQFHRAVGSQSGIYFFRLDGATGAHTAPALIDDPRGHGGLQRFPDILVDAGSVHALWWDSRNDPCYGPARPLGNCADRSTVASLDAFGTVGAASTLSWAPTTRLSDVSSNPNWEQFGGRTVPFGGAASVPTPARGTEASTRTSTATSRLNVPVRTAPRIVGVFTDRGW